MPIKKQPNYRLSGINPLAYMGVEPYTPPDLHIHSMDPTVNDNRFNIGTLWTTRNPAPLKIWMLVDLDQGVATWALIWPQGGGTINFVANIGSAAPSGGTLNVPGVNVIETTGSGNTLSIALTNGSNGQVIIGGGGAPAWANLTAGSGVTITNGANSITISSSSGQGVDSVPCDTGSAAPVAGVLNIYGSNLINTEGSGNTVTVALDLSLDGQIPIGSTAGATLMGNITPGAGIGVANGHNSITVSTLGSVATSYVADGPTTAVPVGGVLNLNGANIVGTFASGNTVHFGLIPGLDGQIPIAATGSTTEYANITSIDGSVIINNGANTIDLSATGGSNPAASCNFFLNGGATGITLNTNIPIYFGQWTALTKQYDIGTNCTVGSGTGIAGTPATFTAPRTGKYLLGISAYYGFSGGSAPLIMQIITTSATYLFPPFQAVGAAGSSNWYGTDSVLVPMTAGDTAIFGFVASGIISGSITFRMFDTGTSGFLTYMWGYQVA